MAENWPAVGAGVAGLGGPDGVAAAPAAVWATKVELKLPAFSSYCSAWAAAVARTNRLTATGKRSGFMRWGRLPLFSSCGSLHGDGPGGRLSAGSQPALDGCQLGVAGLILGLQFRKATFKSGDPGVLLGYRNLLRGQLAVQFLRRFLGH